MKIYIIGLIIVTSLSASIESDVDAERFIWKNNVLTDKFAEIQWQDNKEAESTERNLSGAKNYCRNLTLNGKHDWRLLSKYEAKYSYYMKKHLKFNKALGYWTSTDSSRNLIKFGFTGQYYDRSSKLYHARCVRGGNKESTLKDIIAKVEKLTNEKIDRRYQLLFQKTKKVNSIKSYTNYIDKYKRSNYVKNAKIALNKLISDKYIVEFNKVKEENKLDRYLWFIKEYPAATQVKKAREQIHKIVYSKIEKENKIDSYQNFIKKYPNTFQVNDAITAIYKLITNKNNIVGYEWFIQQYPKAPLVKDAIKNIHKIAYNKAKNINTISAYNTFVYAYPYASEVEESNAKAYKIDIKRYTDLGMLGFFGKEDKMEKKARKLLIKAKQIERTSQDYSGNAKAGYIIVANRMYDLLQEKFDDSEATLRHLESQEFKDFVKSFKSIMGDIKDTLNKINSNVSDIGYYAKQMVDVSKKGLADAKADRAMTAYHEKKKTEWNKLMHFKDKGYN